jgi:oligoribonuclease NrnB/cAMP/cGMP phosphodiesterase (DHH superfamily)
MKAQYHNAPATIEDVAGRDVYIVDFSYPKAILEELKEHARLLYVFDHHASVDQDAKDLPYFTFDNNRSGAGLAWDFFFEGQFRPRIVNYVQDRDLWNWEMEKSLEVNTWINSWNFSLANWDMMHDRLEEEFNAVVLEGTAQVRLQDRLVRAAVGGATGLDIAGFRVPSVNSCLLQSEIGNELAKGKPFSAVWFDKRGKRIYSLRSTDEGEDVSVIAKAFGGGGHRNAAGFAVDLVDEHSVQLSIKEE